MTLTESIEGGEEYHEELNPPPEGSATGVGKQEKVLSVSDSSNEQDQLQHRYDSCNVGKSTSCTCICSLSDFGVYAHLCCWKLCVWFRYLVFLTLTSYGQRSFCKHSFISEAGTSILQTRSKRSVVVWLTIFTQTKRSFPETDSDMTVLTGSIHSSMHGLSWTSGSHVLAHWRKSALLISKMRSSWRWRRSWRIQWLR